MNFLQNILQDAVAAIHGNQGGANRQGIDIQGSQNPGLIPVQGSHGPAGHTVATQPAADPMDARQGANIQVPSSYPPEITYNPNPRTNIPFSTHDYLNSLNLNQLFKPGQVSGMQPQYGQDSNFSTPIQGVQNPGYIPMQGSGFSPSGTGFTRGFQGGNDQNIQGY